jgi:hypothetical protein
MVLSFGFCEAKMVTWSPESEEEAVLFPGPGVAMTDLMIFKAPSGSIILFREEWYTFDAE